MVQPGNWKTSGKRDELTINGKRLWKVIKDQRVCPLTCLRRKQARGRNKSANELLLNGLKDYVITHAKQDTLFLTNPEPV
jgi:hypothetical protein